MRTENVISRTMPARPFGRKGIAMAIAARPQSTLTDDLKLFALTFAAGFLFVSLYLA
jgi:hypothetical protein